MKAIALATLLAFSAAAQGAPADAAGTLLHAETLRQQPRLDAPGLAALPIGEPVDVLASRPGWYRVASAAGTGWVRMFSVARPTAAAAAATPQTAPAPEATRGVGTAPAGAAARATSHALILGIGEFKSTGIPPLPGVVHDMRSARDLALSMGVPAAQISVVRNSDLSLDGMVRTVQQLAERVQPGDRVFLYFSGHGTRYRDSGRPGNPCVTSLLTHDGEPFTDSMMVEALNLLAEKTDKLFVFVDACFSGGAVAAARGAGLTPKFFARASVVAQCGTPSNVVTRGLGSEGPQRWKARDNFIYLTAARDTEIAFEEAAAGGFATRAFRDCAMREARDLDGSGNLSIDEIRQCAQQRIDAWLAPSRDYTPHHLTVFGNRDFVPTLAPPLAPAPVVATAPPAPTAPTAPPAAATIAVAPAATAPAATLLPGTVPPVATPPATAPPAIAPSPAMPPPTPTPRIHPERTLRDIYGQRDDRREVSVQVLRNVLTVGQDRLELTVSSTHPGYLYLLYAGSDGTSFDMLFPNQLDSDNFILRRRPVPLPRAGWALQARGPAGTNRLLAIVADAPRDFSRIGLRPAGAFSSIAATPDAARGVAFVATTSTAAAEGDCTPEPASPGTDKRCSNSFGAALVDIREVP